MCYLNHFPSIYYQRIYDKAKNQQKRAAISKSAIGFNILLFGCKVIICNHVSWFKWSRQSVPLRHRNLALKNPSRQSELDLNTFCRSFIVAEAKIRHHKIQGKPIFKRQEMSFLDLVHTKVKTSKGA